MKKLALLFGFSVLSSICSAQFNVSVDERFEFTSCVFALAGVPEYCQCDIPSYWDDINKELTRYEFTSPIHFIRELNQKHGIGYDAVSTTAEMLEIRNGKIYLQPQYNISEISKIDPRWNEDLLRRYIEMLNEFYQLSNFHDFYLEHTELYEIAEQRLNKLLDNNILNWFNSFFGKPLNTNITVYASLCNGPNNYSMQNGILIGILADNNGLPDPKPNIMTYTIIHEIGHHYTNQLFSNYWPLIKDAADKMYPYIQDQMVKSAYGNVQTVFCEWLNNLITLMYIRELDSDFVNFEYELKNNIESGFIWMQRSVDFMDNYYKSRSLYRNIEDFMPQLIAFLNYTAQHYDLVLKDYENRLPTVTNVYPAVGSNIYGFDEISITFSEPMNASFGFSGTGTNANLVKELPMIYENIKWSNDKRQLYITIDKAKIEKDCTYGIQLFPRAFSSTKYFWLDERCMNLYFTTH